MDFSVLVGEKHLSKVYFTDKYSKNLPLFYHLFTVDVHVPIIYIYKAEKPSVRPSIHIPMASNEFLASQCTYQSIFCAKVSAHHLRITLLLNEASNNRRLSFTARVVQGCNKNLLEFFL